MKKFFAIVVFFIATVIYSKSELIDHHIVIVTASYNNERWAAWNARSVCDQTYDNYTWLYINDGSTDATAEIVRTVVEEAGKSDHLVMINNHVRRGRALENQYYAIHKYCKPDDIVIILDGDDRLSHDNVLAFIDGVYQDPSVWMTYGQFQEWPTMHRGWAVDMPRSIVARNAFREFQDIPTHLRTFYAGLFMKIKKEDLMHEGQFFKMTGDMGAMMPMIETAHEGHFKFISEILLDYNTVNPISDHRVSVTEQRFYDQLIRHRMARYEAIQTPFDAIADKDL